MQLILNNQLWRIKRLTCFYYTCIQSIFCMGEISGETIFIDGTKIEASANKYTFVWKKAVTKNQAKLLQKLADFVAECELLYDIKIVYGNTIKIKHVKKLRKKLYALKETENIVFVHGIGKRKTPLQKSIETLESYLNRLKKYNQQIHICAGRNSYSKTDHDATFMRMKEDAMRNGQLKPAYNLQHGVDSEYITWLTIGPQPTDTTTLIPFLKDAQEHLKFKYKNITADAGYESEENYLFLEANGQLSYIKPANYEISKTRKYKNDRRRDSLQDKPKHTGGRLLGKFKTGYAVTQIFKQRKCKYSCRKYVACHGKKHKQTA